MGKENVDREGEFEILTSERLGVIPHMESFWGGRKLVALAGPAYCGKDTVAGILRREFPAVSLAFADPIRTMLRTAFNLTDEHFFGKLKEVPLDWLGKSPRQMMQTLGTEWGRGLIHEDLWLMLAERKVEEIHNSGFHAVITDCRFENEATRVRANGGVVWHIKRSTVKAVSAHISEAGVAFVEGDKIIDNTGTLEELVDEVCANFQGRYMHKPIKTYAEILSQDVEIGGRVCLYEHGKVYRNGEVTLSGYVISYDETTGLFETENSVWIPA